MRDYQRRKRGRGIYTLLYIKQITKKDLLIAQGTVFNIL